jgi:integrase
VELAELDQTRVLAAIPEVERGIFLVLARLGLRPGEARALTVADYHDGWITVDKAIKGKTVTAPVRRHQDGAFQAPAGQRGASRLDRALR